MCSVAPGNTPAGDERLLFAFGSYNAAYARIYEAFRKAAAAQLASTALNNRPVSSSER